jgi:hypothetical protein
VAKNAKITVQYSHSYELTPSRQNKKSPSVLIHGAAALRACALRLDNMFSVQIMKKTVHKKFTISISVDIPINMEP